MWQFWARRADQSTRSRPQATAASNDAADDPSIPTVSCPTRASAVFELGAAAAAAATPPAGTTRKDPLPLSGSEAPYRELADPAVLAASSSYSYALGDLRPRREPPLPGERAAFSLKRQCTSVYDACKLFGEAMLADNPMRVYALPADRPCKEGYYKVMMFLGRNRSRAAKAAAGAGRQRQPLEVLFFRQHNGLHCTVGDDTPIGAFARWLGVQPEAICTANQDLSLSRTAMIPAGQAVHVPGVNCWSYLLDAGFPPSVADTQGALVRDPRKAAKDFGSLPAPDGDDDVEVAVRFSSFCGAYCVQDGQVATGAP